MIPIGIFFGSDTGNTEQIATMIEQQLKAHHISCTVKDIASSSAADLVGFELLILGIPTWYYGEAQCDWDDFFPTLKTIDLHHQQVALFGCGDQEDYAEYFCDAMGTLAKIVTSQGGSLIGRWSTVGYTFEASKALADETHFVGLALDEDRQPELTAERVEGWVAQICQESSCLSKSTGM
ncbi:flavodoxin FldA [unidentified bacterial endosymbiont]|uniref:flavodoxin FldA n=1 Tax=unidentified bacterial endosymbiont TaxID=2355 RepID=UPI00209D31ED|nr:flavodoxin FldA [unidentified bacterial endosymbiont]